MADTLAAGAYLLVAYPVSLRCSTCGAWSRQVALAVDVVTEPDLALAGVAALWPCRHVQEGMQVDPEGVAILRERYESEQCPPG